MPTAAQHRSWYCISTRVGLRTCILEQFSPQLGPDIFTGARSLLGHMLALLISKLDLYYLADIEFIYLAAQINKIWLTSTYTYLATWSPKITAILVLFLSFWSHRTAHRANGEM